MTAGKRQGVTRQQFLAFAHVSRWRNQGARPRRRSSACGARSISGSGRGLPPWYRFATNGLLLRYIAGGDGRWRQLRASQYRTPLPSHSSAACVTSWPPLLILPTSFAISLLLYWLQRASTHATQYRRSMHQLDTSGLVRVDLNDPREAAVLNPGETFTVPRQRPHRVTNAGIGIAEFPRASGDGRV